ncbi:MAG: iron chelate uptake ABC transporter family permease subunit [Beijerinckiaceae bacterium]|nr:iron chelate uptake ABC transporter family permease subunit [Beijerinckiaceae bacterium]
MLAGLFVLSLFKGAVALPAGSLFNLLGGLIGDGNLPDTREALILANIRLPRTLLAMLVGAALAVSGAILQGLFRNPLADPGLIGVSAGAALAAGITIVFGETLLAPAFGRMPYAILPLGAFLGGLGSTLVLYRIATRAGRTSIATMMLAGVALGALSGAMSGFLAYLSDDRQLRDLTFWALGSFSGASWTKLAAVAPAMVAILVVAPFLARGLDALALGEAEAYHLGLPVQRVKAAAILITAVAVGTSVAVAGMIGFVGLVVPHVLRLLLGASHRLLLPFSAMGGAVLLLGADIVARLVVAPAELPIGILTAAIGAPFFLWLLLRRQARPFE